MTIRNVRSVGSRSWRPVKAGRGNVAGAVSLPGGKPLDSPPKSRIIQSIACLGAPLTPAGYFCLSKKIVRAALVFFHQVAERVVSRHVAARDEGEVYMPGDLWEFSDRDPRMCVGTNQYSGGGPSSQMNELMTAILRPWSFVTTFRISHETVTIQR